VTGRFISIRRDLDELREKVERCPDSGKRLIAQLERIAAIEKHLSGDKKTAA
jgi:hypothetical protein